MVMENGNGQPQKREVKPLFELGAILLTPGALATLVVLNISPGRILARHVSGDWGDLTEDDRRENQRALKDGARIMSAYRLSPEHKVWVITEADRSATTILLPEEY